MLNTGANPHIYMLFTLSGAYVRLRVTRVLRGEPRGQHRNKAAARGPMTIFVVIPKTPSAALDDRVVVEFPDDSQRLDSGAWLISSAGTTQSVSKALGITEADGARKLPISAIVFATVGYWGRAPNTIWEWLKSKIEGAAGG